MKKKIKNWIIRKLGGIVYEDLSPKIKREMMYEATTKIIEMAENSIDKSLVEMLQAGGSLQYAVKEDPEYKKRIMGNFGSV